MLTVLLTPTSRSWLEAAIADLACATPRLLIDHAHCEKKAAAMALRHIERHAGWPRLAARMSRLAREELVHFERVLEELRARGMRFRGQPGSGYGSGLLAAVRPPSAPPAGGVGSWLGDRTVDEMLVCALIEARSHERFVLLAEALGGEGLGSLYADLRDAEARHGEIYLELASEASGGGDAVVRLAELVAVEARVVARPGMPLRIHAGG